MKDKVYDAFDSIKAEEYLKIVTRQHLHKEREKRQHRYLPSWIWKTAAVMCTVLVMAGAAEGYKVLRTPVSYISIDVNPSLELELNCFARVITAQAYNEEAKRILEGISVRGEKYTEAIEIIMESEEMSGYLEKNPAPVFAIATEEAEKKELQEGLENHLGIKKYESEILTADVANAKEAHENGMSVGKYQVSSKLSEYDDTISIDDCQNMSVPEICNRLQKHEERRHRERKRKNSGKCHGDED